MKVGKNSIIILLLVLPSILFGQLVTLENHSLSGKKIRFACHYAGKIYFERDVSANENGKAVFYNDTLASGVYYIIFPDSSSYEFMYDSDYPHKTELAYNTETAEYFIQLGSEITLAYDDYIKASANIGVQLSDIKLNLKQNDLRRQERKQLLEKRETLRTQQESYINTIISTYETSVLAAYLKAQVRIQVPEYNPQSAENNSDSVAWNWRMNYYNKHYLDNLNLTDHRLLNTPIYTLMVDKYLDKSVSQNPQELNRAIDHLMFKAGTNEITEKFLSKYLLDKYNEKKNTDLYEVVYLHIIQKYYLHSDSEWITARDRNILSNEYNSRKPLEIGQTAPKIEMGTNLYDLNSNRIIVYFFNYSCEHCEVVSKELKKISIKMDSENITLFAVCLGNDNSECEKYIANLPNNWQCAFDNSKINDIATRYNLQHTPTIFLLDSEKRILAKNLTTSKLKAMLGY